MALSKECPDFVKWLQSQLDAFRDRRFEELDVDALACELEPVVGKYRSAVRRHAHRLFRILMRPYYVYGDWNDRNFERSMLGFALKDSPSLADTADSDIAEAYSHARVEADLHGESGWPEECHLKTLEALFAAAEARDAEYIALEQEGDADFASGRCAPWKSTRHPPPTRPRGRERRKRAG
jgi:hypothetical protein